MNTETKNARPQNWFTGKTDHLPSGPLILQAYLPYSHIPTHKQTHKHSAWGFNIKKYLPSTQAMWTKLHEFTQQVTLDHLRLILWTVLGSSVLVSLLTSVAMMNTTLKKIETYNQRTELAHQHELEYQRKILLGNGGKPSPLSAKVNNLPSSTVKKSGTQASSPPKLGSSIEKSATFNEGSGTSKVSSHPSGFQPTGSKKPSSQKSSSPSASSPSSPPPSSSSSMSSSPWSSPNHPSPSSGSNPRPSSGSAAPLFTPPPGETKEQRLPKVIIVGVSKCGTRALLDYLALHPNIVTANKEINFFTNVSLYNKGPDVYKSSMPLSYSNQLTVEKSPDYFECEMCPERIIAIDRYVKLLVILCNPVDRLVSQYMQLREKNDQSGVPMSEFEEWAVDPITNSVKKTVASIRTGLYDEYLTNWFRFFHPESIHVIDGSTFIKDPVGEMRKVESFLEIKHFLTSEDIYYNATKGFHCMYSRMTKKSHCLGPTKGRPHIKITVLGMNRRRTGGGGGEEEKEVEEEEEEDEAEEEEEEEGRRRSRSRKRRRMRRRRRKRRREGGGVEGGRGTGGGGDGGRGGG
ncbi:sulfotransferase [Plakobranchus ocellatus]|uniref:Sulfotransferase n=1 Tax=Plakobranchus ocellatus TaxID=259542 RepID=A0AAV4ASN1_9GAST|nr:sulfotransferase [Plakobranchus ocellatus]